MASSSYHYGKYQEYKKLAQRYGKNISALTDIKNNLTGSFCDEQGDVNRELDELKEDLNKAVRHDSRFSVIAGGCDMYKERSTTADACLNHAVIALENEIASLNARKMTAEQNSDAEYRNYEEAKRREDEEREEQRRRWLESLKLFG
ncbi:MAG: hypothetical protein NC121_18035 [Blautia sp.]|nr:hypothetical protein [Blautia sp.]